MAGATLLFTQRAPRPLTRKGKSDPLGGPLIVEPHRITKLQCEMEAYIVAPGGPQAAYQTDCASFGALFAGTAQFMS